VGPRGTAGRFNFSVCLFEPALTRIELCGAHRSGKFRLVSAPFHASLNARSNQAASPHAAPYSLWVLTALCTSLFL